MTRFLSLLGGLGLLLCTEFIDTACAQAEDDATHGMVVTTTGEGSAAAGVALLKRGGTAMDAAMAATMLQPCLAAGSYVSYAGITNVVYFQAASGKVYNLSAGFNTVRGETDPLSIPGVTAEKLAAGGVRACSPRRRVAQLWCPASSRESKRRIESSASDHSARSLLPPSSVQSSDSRCRPRSPA